MTLGLVYNPLAILNLKRCADVGGTDQRVANANFLHHFYPSSIWRRPSMRLLIITIFSARQITTDAIHLSPYFTNRN